MPNLIPSIKEHPWDSFAATAPLKQSPAAVVSVAFTDVAFNNCLSSLFAKKTPCEPKVIATLVTPNFKSFSAAHLTESLSEIEMPDSNSA